MPKCQNAKMPKCQMPNGKWQMANAKGKRQNTGVLRFAQNDKQKKRDYNRGDYCVRDGLHPTHRKGRDGWGTRFVVAGEGRRRQPRIPYGDDNKKATAKAFSAPVSRVLSLRRKFFCGRLLFWNEG
jgi:hypothetical protein